MVREMFRNFKTDPPVYIEDDRGDKRTEFMLVSTKDGVMAVAAHNILRVDGSTCESWDVSGVDGFEWEFDLEYDIDRWMPLPYILERDKWGVRDEEYEGEL